MSRRSAESSARAAHRTPNSIVAEVRSALTASLVLEEVLTLIAERTAEAMDVWACDIRDYDPESDTLRLVAWWCREPTDEDQACIGTVVRLEDRPAYEPVVGGGRTVATYIDEADLPDNERAIMEKRGESGTLCTPLVFGDEVIGVLGLIESRAARRFSDEDKELFRLLAVPAAIAIHNARLYTRQKERNRHLGSLLESSRAMSSTFVLEDVLELVARMAGEALGSDECIIYEHDREDDALVFRTSYSRAGDPLADVVGSVYPLDDHPQDRLLLEGGVVVEETVSDELLAPGARASMEENGEMTVLSVPLTFNSEPMGLLCLIEKTRERRFAAEEMALARALGEQAAAAIQNAKLYRREETRSRRLVGLLEASRAMTSSLELPEVFARLETEVACMLSGRACTVEVRVRDADERFLPFRAALQEERERRPRAAIAPPGRVVSQALAVASARRGTEGGAGRLAVPLLVRDVVEGYIEVIDPAGRGFAEEDVELVSILANQAAVALQNGRLYETFRLQAITDGLTGLYNYRFFHDRLKEEVAKAGRYGLPLSLLMLDLDDFKRFNDAHGHPAGDEVLREVAEILRRQLRRQIDVVARYGGEEFAVILPNTPAAGAEAVGDRLHRQVSVLTAADDVAELVGERIRAHVAEARFRDDAGQGGVNVTVSIGVATLPGDADDAEGLVQAADKALYLAKRLGKNRVEIFG